MRDTPVHAHGYVHVSIVTGSVPSMIGTAGSADATVVDGELPTDDETLTLSQRWLLSCLYTLLSDVLVTSPVILSIKSFTTAMQARYKIHMNPIGNSSFFFFFCFCFCFLFS
jgi:hypothetical protein